ncbi:hypothetical protein LTR87_016420 [Friedmanniomyces endolithicus]|nr:hypothetical protein LTR87_016420 [Friedmanniomyces endolithicus]
MSTSRSKTMPAKSIKYPTRSSTGLTAAAATASRQPSISAALLSPSPSPSRGEAMATCSPTRPAATSLKDANATEPAPVRIVMLNSTKYTRTIWSRDAYTVPTGTNVYGKHPIYLDNRGDLGTHGVFLLNSNGMDIKINNTAADGQYPEYNTLGGVPDFYFRFGYIASKPLLISVMLTEGTGRPAKLRDRWQSRLDALLGSRFPSVLLRHARRLRGDRSRR